MIIGYLVKRFDEKFVIFSDLDNDYLDMVMEKNGKIVILLNGYLVFSKTLLSRENLLTIINDPRLTSSPCLGRVRKIKESVIYIV